MAEEAKIEVLPTGQPGPQYSDIALTNIFATHAAAINSQRQALWQIFAAMVVANSFPLSLLATGIIRGWAAATVGIAGVVLCLAWHRLNHYSWQIFWMRLEDVRKYSWPARPRIPNPFVIVKELEAGIRPGEPIYRVSLVVIFTFLFLYILFPWFLEGGSQTARNLAISFS